jgi:hypothetical protein
MAELAQYKIVNRPRKDRKNIEGIENRHQKGRPSKNTIDIEEWTDWDSSFWVRIERSGDYVIVDSGVIEELAEKIKYLRKERGDIDVN